MKKHLMAAAMIPALALAACGGGTTETTSNVVVDNLNTSAPLDESAFGNEATFNETELNALSPIDNGAAIDGAIAADNASNAL